MERLHNAHINTVSVDKQSIQPPLRIKQPCVLLLHSKRLLYMAHSSSEALKA